MDVPAEPEVSSENINPPILVVDDEIFNLEILAEHLEDAGYTPVCAKNGVEAWDILQNNPGQFNAVLLDRMMPEMDGIQVLENIKAHSLLKKIPVIMQTAKAASEDVLEGLKAGAHYYLTKPFDRDHLLAIVRTAVNDYKHYCSLQNDARDMFGTLNLMKQGMFMIKNLDEGRHLAALLSNTCMDTDKVVLGLSELIINAIEHGNLGIGYDEKSLLTKNGEWISEVSRRLELPENRDKKVIVEFERVGQEARFIIRDDGNGFAWQDYMEYSPERAFDSHGRGVASANLISFDHMEYMNKGNEVLAVVRDEEQLI